MESPVFLLLAGFVVLGVAGEALLRGAVTLAKSLRVSPLVIGLTIIAFGTSAPELTVSLNAVLDGQPDISVGNVVGSNIANILLVLGTMALVSPFAVATGTLARDGGFMLAVSALLFIFGMIGMIDRLFGMALLMGLIAFTYHLYTSARREEDTTEAEAGVDENLVPGGPWLAVLVLMAGIAGVVWGAELMVEGAVAQAKLWGVSEAVIALSLVAVGTSLPELAVSLVAAMRGHAGLAVGNIIGSNISNILLILGATAVVMPLPIADIMAMRDIPIMIGVVCLGLFFLATNRAMTRAEGGISLALYAAYMTYIYIS